MWSLGKKDSPFKNDQLNQIWRSWDDKFRSDDWVSTKTLIKENLFEPIILMPEMARLISEKEAYKSRERADKLAIEFAKISFFIGLEYGSRDKGLALRIPAGGEIPDTAVTLLKIALEPAYEFCISLIRVGHNPLSSVVERDKFLADTRQVLYEKAIELFESGLLASR